MAWITSVPIPQKLDGRFKMEEKPAPPGTLLEKINKDREHIAALDYSASMMEKMAAQAKADTARLNPPAGGSGVVNQPEDPEAKRKELINQAVVLLNNGVDPKIVGQMLSGSTQIPLTVAAAPGGDGGAMGILKTLVDSLIANKSSAEVEGLKVQLKALDDKIAATAKGAGDHDRPAPTPPPSSVQVVKEATGMVRDVYGAFADMGLIPSGPPPGQSIENLKEEHRHKEKMEELAVDKEHKERLGDIAADFVPRIGEGYAKHMMEQAGEGGGAGAPGAGGIEIAKCDNPKCGAPFAIPAEHGEIVFCGNCGQAHKWKEKQSAQSNG